MAQKRRWYALAAFCLISIFLLIHGGQSLRAISGNDASAKAARKIEQLPLRQKDDGALVIGDASLTGHAIAPKLGNATAKAELGRATWKFFHTVMARFPERPTAEESATLKTFIHSFQRVYPCGECAEHFGELLKKFPPQVSGRQAAAGWACHVHNEVNKSLKKAIFDCNNLGDFYDCGCAEDEKNEEKNEKKAKNGQEEASHAAAKTTEPRSTKAKPEMSEEAKERMLTLGRDLREDLLVSD